jgi:hypothetical protein
MTEESKIFLHVDQKYSKRDRRNGNRQQKADRKGRVRSATSPPVKKKCSRCRSGVGLIDQPDHFVSRIFLYSRPAFVAELNGICEILGYTPEQLVIKPD